MPPLGYPLVPDSLLKYGTFAKISIIRLSEQVDPSSARPAVLEWKIARKAFIQVAQLHSISLIHCQQKVRTRRLTIVVPQRQDWYEGPE